MYNKKNLHLVYESYFQMIIHLRMQIHMQAKNSKLKRPTDDFVPKITK